MTSDGSFDVSNIKRSIGLLHIPEHNLSFMSYTQITATHDTISKGGDNFKLMDFCSVPFPVLCLLILDEIWAGAGSICLHLGLIESDCHYYEGEYVLRLKAESVEGW